MKSVVITEKNFNHIVAKLTKFFEHENIACWHQFRGGMKKRIHSMIRDSRFGKFDTMRFYDNVQVKPVHTADNKKFIRIDLRDDSFNYEGFLLEVGYEIAFIGNRIIVKRPYKRLGFDKEGFLYECFQII